MAECEGLALVTSARNENWQDCQGGLAMVAIRGMATALLGQFPKTAPHSYCHIS